MESITFRTIFPKYAHLTPKQDFNTNHNIELFIKEQLPYQVQLVRKMESAFNSFLNQYTNLIIKRPQIANLSYSLSSKATELLDRHFKDCEIKYQKIDKETFNSLFEQANPRRARELFRQKLADIQSLVNQKYIDNHSICRTSEQQIVVSLYSLIELYYFIKGDLVTIASKHQFVESKIASQTFKHQTAEVDQIADSIILESGFTDYIANIVNKRCRPFTNKREFFNAKFKEITKEVESKVQPNLTIFLDSLVSKERHRITKTVVPKIQAILKNIGEIPEEKNCRQIMQKVESMKKKFMGIKNNSYYFDIVRGNFNQKYKMELGKIENLYYLNNLEKYLQEAFQFMEELLAVEQEIIENRKSFTSSVSKRVEDEIFTICNPDNEPIGIKFQSLIYDYFERLKDSCYRAQNQQQNQSKTNSRAEQLKFQREERERLRREEQERSNKIRRQRQEQERAKRQQMMAQANRKKQQQEDRRREERLQIEKRQQSERIKRLQIENAERKRREEEKQRIESERKRKEQEEDRKRREKAERQREERQRREEQQRRADQQERQKRLELQRKQNEAKQEQQRKRQDELRRKKEEEQERRRQQEDRKKRQRQLDERNKREEEQRIKEIEEAKKRKEREEREEEQRIIKEESERKQKQEKKRKQLEQQKRKDEEQKREQEQQKKRIAEEKKKEEERKKEEQRKRQEAELKRKQEQEERRLQQDRKRKQEQKKKEEEEQRRRKEAELQRKKEEEEKEKQRVQEQKKRQLEKKKKAEQQKRIDEERERKERELAEQREEEERKKKQASLKAASKKNEPPKKSAVNYGDYDDELIDEDEDLRKPTQIKNKDDQYVQEYDDDFDDFSPEKDGEEGENPIEPKKLIEIQQVKCLNDYLKGTSYARKNKPNIQNFNNQNQYLYIFEEFIQNHKLFVYDHSIAKAILDFSAQLQDESINEEDLKLTLDTIKEEIDGSYAKQLDTDQFDPNTKLVFPFSFENELNIQIIQVFLPIKHVHFVFGTEPEQTEEVQQAISSLVEAFLHLYEFEDPQVTQSVLPQESKAIIDIYKGELPNLLIMFVKHYQQTLSPEEPILINQYTVQRFFYISHALSPLYEAIENENEQLTDFYSQIAEKYSADEKNRIVFAGAQTTDQNYQQILEQFSNKIKEDFLNGKLVNCLVCFQLDMIDEENEEDFQKLNIYMCLSRDPKVPKPVLNYFIVYKNAAEQQDQSQIFEIISSEMDDEFETNVYMDYTRHNGLSQYSEWMLPLWAHTTQKRKMSPDQAFRALTLSMTPLYVAYKQWD